MAPRLRSLPAVSTTLWDHVFGTMLHWSVLSGGPDDKRCGALLRRLDDLSIQVAGLMIPVMIVLEMRRVTWAAFFVRPRCLLRIRAALFRPTSPAPRLRISRRLPCVGSAYVSARRTPALRVVRSCRRSLEIALTASWAKHTWRL